MPETKTVIVPSGQASPTSRHLLAACDSEQAEAITSEAMPLLVVAGAGSGKTRVLTRRIAWRVETGSAEADGVLALTFTRKAAGELRDRLRGLGLSDQVRAGTFHAMALSELKRLAVERSVAPPVVLPSKVRLLAEGRRGERTSGGPTRATEPTASLAELAQEIEWAKSRLIPPRRYEEAATLAGRGETRSAAAVADAYQAYEVLKARRGVLDFEDLLSCCAREMERDPPFAASARFRLRHFFVDEYQDVNPAQLQLLKAWLGESRDLFAVGDPDQAIYAWNGSDPAAIGRFADEFEGASVLRLRANYRSSFEVVQVAGAALGRSEAPAPTGGREGPIPTIRAYESDLEEAAAVASDVRLAKRPGRSWSQIAVLARTNAQLAVVGEALDGRRIPWMSTGTGSIVESPLARDLLAAVATAKGADALRSLSVDLRVGRPVTDSGEAAAEAGEDAPFGPTAADSVPEARALARLVEEYLAEDVSPTGVGLRAWLEEAARGSPDGTSDSVALATFHRSKGLEWPVVFLVGLEEGLVPIAHARDPAALAEERRLLYVSCTRAEEELHCSWSRLRHFAGASRPSRRAPSMWLAALERAARDLEKLNRGTQAAARQAIADGRRLLAGP